LGSSRSPITRIALAGILTILLFIVLSTATYAWYSTNNVVDAGSLTFKSALSDDVGTLTIGKNVNSESTEISFDAPEAVAPMIPVVNGIIGTTTFDAFTDFQRTFEGLDGMGRLVAKIDGERTAPLVLAIDGQEYFYINNFAVTETNVQIEYEIKGELAEKMHIAMFVGEEATEAKLLCVMSKSGVIHYGEIKLGEIIADKPVMDNAYVDSGNIFLKVGANASERIRLVVWLDGVDMKTENGGKNTSFTLNFKGLV